MAHWWRYLLTITAGVAAAAPVQLQLDFGSLADLQLVRSAALAEAGEGGNGNGGGNGGGNGNGNNGNGNGNGNAGGNSGNGPNGNGNSGNGNGGGKGGNGNAGGNSASGNSGNGNAGNGNAGANNGAGGRGEGNGGGVGSGGNGSGQGGGGGTSSGANPGGSNSDSRGNARGRSGEALGRSRNASGGAGKANGLARGHSSWIGYEVRANQPDRGAKRTATSRNKAAGKQDKVSAEGWKGRTEKSAATRADGKAASGATARSASRPGSSSSASQPTRAGTASTRAREQIVPIGSPSKPRQASGSIVASGLSEQDLSRLGALGLQITSQTRGLIAPRVVRLRLPGGMTIAEARRAVQRVSQEASADADSYYYTDGGAPGCTDPGCEVSQLVGWTPPGTNACGAPPLVGLIDTGIDLDHEALRGQSIELLNVSREPGRKSSLDHGTAIAALLVGRADSTTPGLLPQARLVAVDAFSKGDGTADRADVVSLVSALEALADRGVKIVNLSLSGPPNEVLRKAVESARTKGIVLVAAAGNNGAGAEPSYPAAYPGVIAVTAVDRQLNVYRRATRGPYVAFSAPGVEIRTAQASGASAAKSGTSYAVPFVSAAIAMLRAARPETDVEQLQMRLQDNIRDLGAPGRDPTFGYGLVQMANLCSAPGDASPIPVVDGSIIPDQHLPVR